MDDAIYIVSNPNYNFLNSNTRKEYFKVSVDTKEICSQNLDIFE